MLLSDRVCVFQGLLNRAVDKTEGAEVEPLEKLYALLAQCIYRHRNNYNKAELIQVRQPGTEPASQGVRKDRESSYTSVCF